ncbi:hypothetical protein [Bordetella genomosp. 5]|uniref:Lipoprotein n=1 Tax=Bordetella genomosp. 5 TaxID=1395608 RepID=A0A261T7Y2_9BORD|nr:hypothetical protein [Bordetella genomosp. 5]OZI45728.1 hypothetical protein CAL25_21095 [Bordetella genomosp. 5]
MRAFMIAVLTAASGWLAAPAHAAGPSDQLIFEQIVDTAGASNGAARVCGASAPDLTQQEANWRKNLERFAKEYRYDFKVFDAAFQQGQSKGKVMMEDMRKGGVDGCAGVLGGFQRERTMGYDSMKQSIAEVTDGLPDKKD